MSRVEGLRFELDVIAVTEGKVNSVIYTFLADFKENTSVKQLDFSLGRAHLRTYGSPLDE